VKVLGDTVGGGKEIDEITPSPTMVFR